MLTSKYLPQTSHLLAEEIPFSCELGDSATSKELEKKKKPTNLLTQNYTPSQVAFSTNPIQRPIAFYLSLIFKFSPTRYANGTPTYLFKDPEGIPLLPRDLCSTSQKWLLFSVEVIQLS
jgi:hypothetical protein